MSAGDVLTLPTAVFPAPVGETAVQDRLNLTITTPRDGVVARNHLLLKFFPERSGPPVDDPLDLDLDVWAGEVPLEEEALELDRLFDSVTGCLAPLCERARDAGTAAVCVWPEYVARCRAALPSASSPAPR